MTLTSDLASGTTAPVGYKIRKEWTLADIFGATDSSGLQAGDSTTADLVQLWNGSSLDSYYYQSSGAGGIGWRKVGDESTDASGTLIPFYSAVIVKRLQSSSLSITLSGMAKTGQTAIPIGVGDNYLGNFYPADLTLGTCHLHTGDSSTGLVDGDSSSADKVLIWNGSDFNTYYYQTSGSGGAGWRKVGDTSTDASNTAIAAGTGFIVRRSTSSGFSWIVPQTLTATSTSTVVGKLSNISTRGDVQTDEQVLIGGFIITGTDSKKVVIRAIGPSLAGAGVSGTLADPFLELHDSSGNEIATNDNWQTDSGASEIQTNGLAPINANESAMLQTLAPGAYTAVVRGKDDGTGIGLVEVYDLSTRANSKLANISTRGHVASGDDVLIGGFIIGDGSSPTVIIRAIAPSLASSGITGVLADPTLELHDSNGTVIGSNNDWQSDGSASAISAAGLAPSDSHESATLVTLAPGNYTAIVGSADSSAGIALVEIYHLN